MNYKYGVRVVYVIVVLKLKGLLVLVTTGELIPVVEACCLAMHWWDLHLCPSL